MNHIWEDTCPHGREYEIRADDFDADGRGGVYECSLLYNGEGNTIDCCPDHEGKGWAGESFRLRLKELAEWGPVDVRRPS